MRLFITDEGIKYINTDEQVKFCDSILKGIKKKEGCFYECRQISGFIQFIVKKDGIETIYNCPIEKGKTLGEYRKFFKIKCKRDNYE